MAPLYISTQDCSTHNTTHSINSSLPHIGELSQWIQMACVVWWMTEVVSGCWPTPHAPHIHIHNQQPQQYRGPPKGGSRRPQPRTERCRGCSQTGHRKRDSPLDPFDDYPRGDGGDQGGGNWLSERTPRTGLHIWLSPRMTPQYRLEFLHASVIFQLGWWNVTFSSIFWKLSSSYSQPTQLSHDILTSSSVIFIDPN